MILVAGGAFSIVTASTAAAVTMPSGASANTAQLTSVTRSQAAPAQTTSGFSELAKEKAMRARLAAQAKAQKEAAARRAAAKKKAAEEAAAKKKAEAAKKKAAALASGSPQQIAQAMLAQFGWSSSQFSCLDQLWERESGWSVTAANPSGAYGIPQALPGAKMASAGPDWQTSAYTQIKWGLGYIQDEYGSPCGAWQHELNTGWY